VGLPDAQRPADRWSSGDLEQSLISAAEHRQWRWLTRTRVQLRRLIGIVCNQGQGLLEQGGIKFTVVASDLFGVSGWAMLQWIAKGETDVTVLASRRAADCAKTDAMEGRAGRKAGPRSTNRGSSRTWSRSS
jgi:hypothetical protein